MKFVSQLRRASDARASASAKPMPQLETIDGNAEQQLDVRCYLPASWRGPRGCVLPTGREAAPDDARPAVPAEPETSGLLASRPTLVVLGSVAGWACGPAGYESATLCQAFAECESVMVLAAACSELLFHGIATCASVQKKTVLIETVPGSVAAWLSVIRRYAPRSAEVTVEPGDAAFGEGAGELARA